MTERIFHKIGGSKISCSKSCRRGDDYIHATSVLGVGLVCGATGAPTKIEGKFMGPSGNDIVTDGRICVFATMARQIEKK